MQILGILIAALGGLAVGLEREWSGHATGPYARFAGVRTFTLLGLVAGMSGWLWANDSQALATVLLAGAAALVVVAYAAATRQQIEATTEVASLVVLGAGAAAGIGNWALAGGAIALTTLLLVEKSRIHDMARQLDDTSLRAGVRFGVMAIVILPLLPEGPFGPGAGIRPRALWLAVLIFSGLSFLGYIARRMLRGKLGYPVAGILGGMMSSTAVAFSFSRLSRSESANNGALAVGVIGASTLLFLRVFVATLTLNAALAAALAPYLILPFVIGTAVTGLSWRYRNDAVEGEPVVANPLQFWSSLQMAAVFQVVLYIVHGLNSAFGNQGLLVSGAILGLTDVDALTISMARGVRTTDWSVPAQALCVGIIANTLLKAAVSFILGAGPFRSAAAGGLMTIAAATALTLLLKWF